MARAADRPYTHRPSLGSARVAPAQLPLIDEGKSKAGSGAEAIASMTPMAPMWFGSPGSPQSTGSPGSPASSASLGRGSSYGPRAIGLILLALGAFAAVAAALHPAVPWPAEYSLRAKLEYFAAHKDEYDAVFIGTSRVFRAFDPSVFDAEMETRGVKLRSFNLGVGGVRPFEMDFILRAVMAMEPARLRWVFCEGGPPDPGFDNVDPESSRVVFWHSPGETRRVLVSVRRMRASAMEKLSLARRHVQIMLWKLSNFGQGRSFLGAMMGKNLDRDRGPDLTMDEIAQGQGYWPFESSTDAADQKRRNVMLEHVDVFQERMAKIPESNAEPVDLDTFDLDALRDEYRLVEAHGAELIFVVPPDRVGTPDRAALHDNGQIPVLFDFNRPHEYPQLFTLESRFDPGHMSRSGAAEVSRLLAEQFALHLKRKSKE